LIIVTDDQRLETLSVMPKTRRWFVDEGTRFTRTFATTPLCCPSRASIMTGRYAHNHEVRNNVPGTSANLAQTSTLQYNLRNAGYRTGIFREDPPYFHRWAVTHNGYYGAKFNVMGDIRRISDYSTDYIAAKAENFITESARRPEPWFLYLAPNAPHRPFTPERRYQTARVPGWSGNPAVFESDRSDKPGFVRNRDWTFKEGSRQRRLQLRTLMSVDDLVGRVFRLLQETGQGDNTLAVFVSDNGFFWGDHGLNDKRLPYTPSIQVPMLVRWPGHFAADVTDSRVAANIDVAPTVFDAAGISPSNSVDGKSLLESWDRDRILTEYRRDYQVTSVPTWASIRTDDYQYVEYYSSSGSTVVFREYYDLAADPWQLENLLRDGDPSNNPDVAALSGQLYLDRHCDASACP
jgi:arylsulfatase A-like enzyme